MRRFLFGVVIASMTAAIPNWAMGGDREIAEGIMTQLQEAKSEGKLKGFDLDLKVESGVVYLTGNVRSADQHQLIVDAVERTGGVAQLVDQLNVAGDSTEQRPESKGFSLSRAIKRGPSISRPAVAASTVVPASADETAQPSSSDTSITDTIIGKLQQQKQVGSLKGFDLDVTTNEGEVAVRGRVMSPEQKALVLDIARRVRGVRKVIDDVAVGPAVRQVSTTMQTAPAIDAQAEYQPALQPVPPAAGAPAVVAGSVPQAYGPVVMQNGQACYPNGAPIAGGAVVGGGTGMPVPMQAGGAAYGMGVPRYDQPYMPSYAWPSYAAYPNYAAVTYPKQYSPSAWPYIGPFYPYPQVPLGWRKVALEWDDGLWYLDFTSK